jgi:hypothetical protein
MTIRMHYLLGLTALSIFTAGSLLSVPASAAQPLTAVEKLYAELAKLPDAERSKKILEGAIKEGKFTFLNTTSGKKGSKHMKLFRKRYPSIKGQRGELSPEAAGEQIVAEARASRWISDGLSLALSDMGDVLKNNIAARNPTPVTSRVRKEFEGTKDPQNRWVPWRISEQGISYNPVMLKQMKVDPPTSYMSLCDPKYKGQVAMDTAATRVLTGLRAIMGEEKLRQFLECLGKNEPIIQRGQTNRIMLMMAGDHAIQGSNSLYKGVAANKKNPKKAPFEAVYSAPIMIYPTGLIISSNAPHPYGAALFVDWALSKEAQGLVTGWGRGNVTQEHPFFPPEAQLVIFGMVPEATRDKLHSWYVKYLGKKKG